jgi:hypothetical protein
MRPANPMRDSDLPVAPAHDGATVLLYSALDERHRHTGNTTHTVNGMLLGSARWLLIYQCGSSYYLMGDNPEWEVNICSLTRHDTLEEAERQAEYEYEGVCGTWQRVEQDTI